jgi:hypothetical protein
MIKDNDEGLTHFSINQFLPIVTAGNHHHQSINQSINQFFLKFHSALVVLDFLLSARHPTHHTFVPYHHQWFFFTFLK